VAQSFGGVLALIGTPETLPKVSRLDEGTTPSQATSLSGGQKGLFWEEDKEIGLTLFRFLLNFIPSSASFFS
jgi:hypothetical protein